MRPKFEPDEEFLIAYYRQYRPKSRFTDLLQDIVIVLVASSLFGLGLFKDDIIWTAIGFAIVALRVFRGITSSARYNRTLAAIIGKYETAVNEASDPASSSTP